MNNSESKSSKKKHKIVKEITKDVSIYNHDKMSIAKLYSIELFVNHYLYAIIQQAELFDAINTFINFKNEKKDNYFAMQNVTISLDNLISMAGVFDEKHIEIFQDIAYKHILSDGDPWERVKKIHMGWRRKALELRDEELKSKNKSHKNIV
jgi:hypothetical protein